jgi:hypothetical protein
VRALLEEPHYAVMATINAAGTPQLTVMWYALHPTEDPPTVHPDTAQRILETAGIVLR